MQLHTHKLDHPVAIFSVIFQHSVFGLTADRFPNAMCLIEVEWMFYRVLQYLYLLCLLKKVTRQLGYKMSAGKVYGKSTFTDI